MAGHRIETEPSGDVSVTLERPHTDHEIDEIVADVREVAPETQESVEVTDETGYVLIYPI